MTPKARSFALAALFAASPASALTIDSYSQPLRENTLLPNSHRRIVFLGAACDGASCPPDTFVTHTSSSDASPQYLVPGIPGGQRVVQIEAAGGSPPWQASMQLEPIGDGAMVLREAHGDAMRITADYTGAAVGSLNLDLLADGADRFVFTLGAPAGAIGPVAVHLSTGNADPVTWEGPAVDVNLSLPGAGTYEVRFVDMTTYGPDPVDWRSVDWVTLAVRVQPGAGVPVSLEHLGTLAGPVPAAPGTWGRIKSKYRR